MALVTHTFNVGNANFVVSHSNGVLIIEDAGTRNSSSYPSADFGKDFGFQDAVGSRQPRQGLLAFQNILRNNTITKVHALISHQDNDHYRLLPDLFELISQENQTRQQRRVNQIGIGKVVVGGNLSEDMSNTLSRAAAFVFHKDKGGKIIPGIKATFVGNIPQEDQSLKVGHRKYDFFQNGQVFEHPKLQYNYIDTPEGRCIQKKLEEVRYKHSIRIPFKFIHDLENNIEDEKYLEILYPTSFNNSSNKNDANLVGKLVTKRRRAYDTDWKTQTGLVWGDATIDVQNRLLQKYGDQYFFNTGWAILPHHLSKTQNQSLNAQRISNPQYSIGSSVRADTKLPQEFQGNKEEDFAKHLFKTRNIGTSNVITSVMSAKHNYSTVYVDDYAGLTPNKKVNDYLIRLQIGLQRLTQQNKDNTKRTASRNRWFKFLSTRLRK